MLKKKIIYVSIFVFLSLCVVILIEYRFNYLSLTVNVVRPLFLNGGGDQCLGDLDKIGIKYIKLGESRENSCIIRNAVRIKNFPNTNLSGPVLLSCPTAKKVSQFFEEIEAKNIKHMGTYNCRSMRGSKIASEHSYGTAIDIAEIDGASIAYDWNQNTEKGLILKKAYSSACRIFTNVLTPDSNSAHKNHFHLDAGIGIGCLPSWANNIKIDTVGFLNRIYNTIF
jgi:hypothetical protein